MAVGKAMGVVGDFRLGEVIGIWSIRSFGVMEGRGWRLKRSGRVREGQGRLKRVIGRL